MKKWFVSCILPEKQLGAIQFEAEEDDVKTIAEGLAPQRCAFRSYQVEEFDKNIPIGEFVDTQTLKDNGY